MKSYNVLIFGASSFSNILEENILRRKVNVIAYVDNDAKRWGKSHRGKK